MRRDKTKKLSIRTWLFFAFVAFTLFVLILLWLFQVVFLDTIYKYVKIGEIEKCADDIPTTTLDDVKETLVEFTYENNICGVIYSPPRLDEVSSSHTDSACPLDHISHTRLIEIYQLAKESKDFYVLRYIPTSYDDADFLDRDFPDHFSIVGPKRNLNIDCMIAAKVITLSDGNSYLIVLNSVLTPVGSTIDTIKSEYLSISVLLILIAGILAFLMSLHLSAPIRAINKKAHKLANGDYEPDFPHNLSFKELNELSNTLNFAATELGRTDQLRHELLSNVSHDLKTPLTLISGYGEVMRDLPGENTPENIQIIIDEANRLTALVNDLLDISKLEAGVIELDKSQISITKLIEEILERYAKLKVQDGYTISFERESDIFVDADQIKLSQVIYNLVNNAINYTGDDKYVKISQTVKDGFVRIEVEDHGNGITKDELSAIWDRYYRSESNHARAPVGSGLGLSIVKKILELHNATFGVNSTPGQGSTFWFMLPIVNP